MHAQNNQVNPRLLLILLLLPILARKPNAKSSRVGLIASVLESWKPRSKAQQGNFHPLTFSSSLDSKARLAVQSERKVPLTVPSPNLSGDRLPRKPPSNATQGLLAFV